MANDYHSERAASMPPPARPPAALVAGQFANVADAEGALKELAGVFLQNQSAATALLEGLSNFTLDLAPSRDANAPSRLPNAEAHYRALVEQIPAVIFTANLDKGIGEAYVSPQIEASLGFTQSEWLEDPVLWYRQVHPDDKHRWSEEAAEMFLSGKPLRSSYRVLARDARVLWFHCEAKMIRRENGRPWFIHGVGVDITELKTAEAALQEERNVLSAILDTVAALVVVLDPSGRIVRFNRACEETTGYSFAGVEGKYVWELFASSAESHDLRELFERAKSGENRSDYEGHWRDRDGTERLISWSSTGLAGRDGQLTHIIATGIDITERKRLEKTILEISAREQRRIGQDLHDGLGQHLTGIAFMSKVLEQKLCEKDLPEASEAQKIVKLVNEAIEKTRELSRGLLPVVSQSHGLMTALRQWAAEIEDLFHIACRFHCEKPVLISDVNAATHLYHIAQEAVNNAIRHGRAERIAISLSASDGEGILLVIDNGHGIQKTSPTHTGMGLSIMGYRARMIGGSFEARPIPGGGTAVTCVFPLQG
jgi:PAS domain S-box-containing protein